jgi:DNA-binding NarL/FixJ family response regulator
MNNFNVIIVEDVMLELRGTVEIFRNEIPEANIIGTAQNEEEFWNLMAENTPELVLLDLGLGGSTTVGSDICRKLREKQIPTKILIFTSEVFNEKLCVDALDARADGIILRSGEFRTSGDVQRVLNGKRYVFNQPILKKLVKRFRRSVLNEYRRQEAFVKYDIDEYDEIFLRHLALGYTKDMIANLRSMPFGTKSLEKRQAELISRLFPNGESERINVPRLVTRAFELRILDVDNLEPDEE